MWFGSVLPALRSRDVTPPLALLMDENIRWIGSESLGDPAPECNGGRKHLRCSAALLTGCLPGDACAQGLLDLAEQSDDAIRAVELTGFRAPARSAGDTASESSNSGAQQH